MIATSTIFSTPANSPLTNMYTFLRNPLESILNLFGLTMKHKPSPLADHIKDFTHSSWLKDVQNQNRLTDFYLKH